MIEAYPPLLQQMLSPDFYPHPVQTPITVRQTHISYVVLTGPYAYKLKKSVRSDQYDFSTLEKRRHFCQEEVRLNQRLAPELYLGVVPLVEGKGGQYRFGDEAEESAAAEVAVKMLQFPGDALFDQMLEEGSLQPVHLAELGRQVARFHAEAETNERIAAYGSFEALQGLVALGGHLTRPLVGSLIPPELHEQTQQARNEFLHEHADLFRRRQAMGAIRDGHGDLHPGNVCLFDGRVLCFDCLEFNEMLRCGDVIHDIAFMKMALDFRGRSDLAERFVAAYNEVAQDSEGMTLLPFYASLRATVRGCVTAFLAANPDFPEAQREWAQAEAQRYFQAALTYLAE